MIKSFISRFMNGAGNPVVVEPTWDSTAPQQHSSLPPEADDVRELNRALEATLREELARRNLAAADIELRRRISRREYRAYISLRTEHDIRKLAVIGEDLVKVVLEEYHIELSRIYWQYKIPN